MLSISDAVKKSFIKKKVDSTKMLYKEWITFDVEN